jgi:hypothetical protein
MIAYFSSHDTYPGANVTCVPVPMPHVPPSSEQVIASEKGVLSIMERLSMFRIRMAMHFSGRIYSFGDFTVRVARGVQRPDIPKGCFVVVEYSALESQEIAHGIMEVCPPETEGWTVRPG